MNSKKKKRLQSQGWKIGNVSEFLKLSNPERRTVSFMLKGGTNNEKIEDLLQKLAVARAQRAAGDRGKSHSQVMKLLRKRIHMMKAAAKVNNQKTSEKAGR